MKKLILFSFVFLGVLLISCDGLDVQKCKQTVIKEFPKAQQITYLVDNNWRCIVIDSVGSIWYVETMNGINTNITKKELIRK